MFSTNIIKHPKITSAAVYARSFLFLPLTSLKADNQPDTSMPLAGVSCVGSRIVNEQN